MYYLAGGPSLLVEYGDLSPLIAADSDM
jgi:hypothetical protein